VRRCIMTVAAMIVGGRTWENPGEWIHPCTRANAALAAV
jgi:hypothetical protein